MPMRTFQLNSVAVVVTQPGCTPPGVPTITAGQVLSDTSIRIKWSKPTSVGSFIKGYEIQYGTTSGGPYPFVVDRPPTPRQFDVPDLSPGTTYYFVIQSIGPSAACRSAFSGESSFTTSGSPGVCVAGTAFATAWAARVVANGGAVPSAATQLAIATFQCGLVTDGLDTSMVAWNAFVPDNLTAARTPQLAGGGAGNDPWTNHNFIAGDLTVNGLAGDAATKYLETGDVTTGSAATGQSLGTVLYVSTVTATGSSTGVISVSALGITAKFTDTNAYAQNGGNPSNQIGTPSHNAGYYSNQRISNSDHRLFFANSGTPHAQIGATDAFGPYNGGVPVPFNMYVGCLNNGGVPIQFASDRVSFVGVTIGLSAAQSALLFARIQTLRTALGGGFV